MHANLRLVVSPLNVTGCLGLSTLFFPYGHAVRYEKCNNNNGKKTKQKTLGPEAVCLPSFPARLLDET